MLEKLSKGQSLFEVIIAIAVSAAIVVGVVSLTVNSIRNATFARNKTLAARYAEETTEWLRGERDNNSEFWVNVAIPVYCLDSLTWSGTQGECASGDEIDGIFLREVTFSEPTPNVIEADISVTWTDAQGNHVVRSTTNFSDWREQ